MSVLCRVLSSVFPPNLVVGVPETRPDIVKDTRYASQSCECHVTSRDYSQGKKDDPGENNNYLFYTNQIPFRPNGTLNTITST